VNSLKSFFMLLVLVGVGYGVYRTLHLKNPQQVPPGVDTSIPAIDLKLGSSVPGTDPGGMVPKFSSNPSSPPPTTLSPREPRRDNIVNAPLALSSPQPSLPAPPSSIGFGEPASPAPRGNDLKLETPSANDNPGSSMLPPLVSTPKTGSDLTLPPSTLTPPAMSGLNAPGNALPSNTQPNNLPPGATPLAGFNAPSNDPNQAALSPFGPVMKETQQLINENKLSEALTRLTRLYDDPTMSASEQQQVNELLNQLAGVVIYSSKHHLLASPHRVNPGETLDVIAKQHNVPWEMLAKINGLTDPKQLPVGEFLKIVPGPFRAEVDLKKSRLTLFLRDQFAGSFDIVHLGSDSQYAAADFIVQKKSMNPKYSSSSRQQQFEAGDPNNPLGNFGIVLADGMMIHGHGAAVPINDPRGSIRLTAKDAEDVHDILSEGSQVKIRR
jgi:LysM repeat protein